MLEADVYTYLQKFLPSNFQWCSPYLDTLPLPKFDTNFGVMVILDRQNYGWTQEVQTQSADNPIALRSDLNRIYHIQIDYYGPNSCDISGQHNQILLNSLQKETRNDVGIKRVSEIRNLTELLENKKYQKRYAFDVELFVVDSVIAQPDSVVDSAIIDKVVISKGDDFPTIIGN